MQVLTQYLFFQIHNKQEYFDERFYINGTSFQPDYFNIDSKTQIFQIINNILTLFMLMCITIVLYFYETINCVYDFECESLKALQFVLSIITSVTMVFFLGINVENLRIALYVFHITFILTVLFWKPWLSLLKAGFIVFLIGNFVSIPLGADLIFTKYNYISVHILILIISIVDTILKLISILLLMFAANNIKSVGNNISNSSIIQRSDFYTPNNQNSDRIEEIEDTSNGIDINAPLYIQYG